MSVALCVGRKRYEIGSASFLKSFFSTIFVLLEHENWGSLYPAIMNGLYSGRLEPGLLKEALLELAQIRRSLAAFPPSQVVWDFEDLTALPPWGSEISDEIQSLADYFVTSDGANLLDVLAGAIETASQSGSAVGIQ